MSSNATPHDELNHIEPPMDFLSGLVIVLAAIIGAFAAVVVLPTWLPGLSQSLLGADPRAYWYLARASGVVAFGLLWVSVALGITITNKLSRVWPGGPTAVDLHQFASLLGLALSIFHVLILLGDHSANYSLAQLLIPFGSGDYRPFWVGLGQVAFYLMVPVIFSFYARKFIGYKIWRLIHYLSFVVYFLVTLHGLWAGTDATTPAMLGLYAITGLATYFLTVYRILASIRQPRRQAG